MTLIKIILVSALIPIILAACSSGDPAPIDDQGPAPTAEITPAEKALPDPTATTEPTAEPTPQSEEPKASPTAEPEPTEIIIQTSTADVTIPGAGDLPIQATLYTPGGSGPLPGIVLLHMLGSDRQVWDDNGLASALVDSGYAVLSVDMRGHGETGSSIDWQLAPKDLRLVWDYFTTLDAVDPQCTAVIGASIGSNLALLFGADQPAIRTVILLSPGLDYRGVATEEPMGRYGERPILIVASEEDTYSADSSRTLVDLAQGKSQLEMYNGAGHGTRMLDAQPELAGLITSWLDQNLN